MRLLGKAFMYGMVDWEAMEGGPAFVTIAVS